MHVCTHCAHTAQRDQNAASVVLIDAHTPGTGVAARPKPLARQRAKSKSETREAHLSDMQCSLGLFSDRLVL
jgi:putative transposase